MGDELVLLDTHVAGVHYRLTQSQLAAMPFAGQPGELEREPENGHDVWAVKVLVHGKHVGYVPATHSRWVSSLLFGGYALTARVSRVGPIGQRPELSIEISIPKAK